MCEGIGQEFTGIDLGHKARNDRARIVLEDFFADPQASINAAIHGATDTKLAYDFFDNPEVDPQQILLAHRGCTEERMQQHPVVLLAQDTTELDYTSHPPQDAGVLERDDRFGLYDHTHLALTPERLCLGVVGVDFFDRTPESLGKSRERKQDPIETKETFRWLEGYRLACELNESHPDTQVVSVADSECDIYEIFKEHDFQAQQDRAAEFVIRAKQNRRSLEKDEEAGGDTYVKVRNQVAESKLRTVREVELPRTPKREQRIARLEIRATEVEVKAPHQKEELGAVRYNLVLVEEVGRPANDPTKVSWLLITTLPIETVEQVLLVVDYYVCRWPIETFFRVFKTGCKVEEIQLETTDRLKRCLMLYKVIAWRLIYLTYLGRECPQLSCDQMFAEEEWKPVWKIVTEKPIPEEAPSLGEFINLLAQLGGYNNRNTEGPPGPQCIWIGIRRMTDFARAWKTFGPPARQNNSKIL